MAATSSELPLSLRLAARAGNASGPTRLEEEVVSLFDQLRVPVLRYLISFRLPVQVAEEIAQEVFLSLFQHLHQGKSRQNLRGWVFRVAHNLALKQRSRSRRELESCGDSADLADSSPRPDEQLEVVQRQQLLLAVVRALPEREQQCLSLRAEGLTYREIAEVLGISLGTVANLLERALQRLARADSGGGAR